MRGSIFFRSCLAVLSAGILCHAGPAGTVKKTQNGIAGKSTSAAAPANKLDTAQIHKTYLEGEFDLAIELIEDAMKYGGPFSHQDSIFILKHLGVMHTAKYETREKGKHYLMELLKVEPTAKILDMYASDMIYMIFKNIRDEFETRNPHLFTNSGGGPQPINGDPQPKKKTGYAWVGWTVGAATVVGGAVLAVHLLEEAESPETRELISND